MTLPFSWLELSILAPLAGAAGVARLRRLDRARHWSVAVTGLSLLCALIAWWEFPSDGEVNQHAVRSMTGLAFGGEIFALDQLSAPLVPLVALLFFLTSATMLRTKMRSDSFAPTLISLSL